MLAAASRSCIGDQVAFVGLPGADIHLDAVERNLRLGHEALRQARHALEHRFDDRCLHDRIALDRIRSIASEDPDRTTRGIDRKEFTLGIECDCESSQVGVPARRRDHRHGAAIGVDGQLRIGTDRLVARQERRSRIREEIVAIRRDRDVDTRERRDQFDRLPDVLHVTRQHDDPDPAHEEFVDRRLHRRPNVRIDDHRTGAREVGKRGRGRSDDSDPTTTDLEHRGSGDSALSSEGRERRLRRHVEVRGKEWDSVPDALDQLGEYLGSEVELVIPEADGVVPDLGERDRIEERHAIASSAIPLRTGEHVVAGGHEKAVALPRGGSRIRNDGREPRHAAEVRLGATDADEPRFGIVVVKKCEAEGVAGAVCRRRHEGYRCCQAQPPTEIECPHALCSCVNRA